MPIELPIFREGDNLNAAALNQIYRAVVEVAAANGMQVTPAIVFVDGTVLTASDLNRILDDVESVCDHMRRPRPSWSFPRFQPGAVLRAGHLNELAATIRSLRA